MTLALTAPISRLCYLALFFSKRFFYSSNRKMVSGPIALSKPHHNSIFLFRIFVLLSPLAFWPERSIAATLENEILKQEGAEKLILDTLNGPHEFKVEIMRTPEELEKGLMFRKYLPANRGMLFDFEAEQPIAMWMKNTYIALDMIFISRQGIVTSISENAEPLSETIISSKGPVYAVLEVNGGTAGKIGLKIGDHVENPIFRP